VQRLPEERTVKKVFKNIPEGKWPRKRWLLDVEKVLKKMGVRGWRKIARDRFTWKLIGKETKVLYGRYSQSRRR
jgi:hypothetical protein